LVLFILGLAVYGVQSIGWPLVGGRDLDEYAYGYIQFFDWHPVLPWSMLFRTPGTPIFAGSLLDVAGGHLGEPALAVLFAGSVVAWGAAARTYSARAALLVVAALLVYPAYALMFHELSSETFFSAAFALWAWLVVRAARNPSAGRFAAVGAGIALLAFIRPGNALLLVFGLFPFLVQGRLRERTLWATALLAAGMLPLAGWSFLNGVRLDYYGLARGGNAVIPFYRAFISDKIVSPRNGPASRELGQAVREHLVTRDPYKAYHVTEHEVFASGSFRIHEDMYLLSDQVFGWDTNYSVLRKVGIEAVKKHPGKYASGVASTVWHQLSRSFFRSPPASTSNAIAPAAAGSRPSEGQPIPAGQNVWISRPDNCIRDVWTSATRHHFTFCNPHTHLQFDHVVRRRDALFANLPDRSGNGTLRLRLDQLSRWVPRPIVWIALGLIGLLWRRPRNIRTAIAIALVAFFVIFFNALGLFADPHFALPVAPAFVLFAAAGLLGSRSADA
jgi:hypothetical protein